MVLAVLAVVLGTGLIVGGAGAPAPAAFSGANGKIAFQSNRDGDFEVYVLPLPEVVD